MIITWILKILRSKNVLFCLKISISENISNQYLNKYQFFLATPNNATAEERILFLPCIIKPGNYLSLIMPSFTQVDRNWHKSNIGAAGISFVEIPSFGPQVTSRS